MRTPRRAGYRALHALTLGVLATLGACSSEDGGDPLLVIFPAAQQPVTEALGVVVLIQSRGGDRLELDVRGGALDGGVTTACLVAAEGVSLRESITPIVVRPAGSEAVLTVRLLQIGSAPATEGSGGGSGGSVAAGGSGGGVAAAGSGGSPSPGASGGACQSTSRPVLVRTKVIARLVSPPASNNGGGSGQGGAGAPGGADAGGGAAGGENGAAGGNGGAGGGAPDASPDGSADGG